MKKPFIGLALLPQLFMMSTAFAGVVHSPLANSAEVEGENFSSILSQDRLIALEAQLQGTVEGEENFLS